MKKSKRLQVIVDLNAGNEKKALEALGKLQSEKQGMQTQLDNLQQYLQEYKDKYQTLGSSGINIKQLLEFRSFIDKLDKAIEEQQQLVSKLNNQILLARNHWEKLYQKTRSLEKVCEAAVIEENKIADKQEQAEQDERASRIGRNSGTRTA